MDIQSIYWASRGTYLNHGICLDIIWLSYHTLIYADIQTNICIDVQYDMYMDVLPYQGISKYPSYPRISRTAHLDIKTDIYVDISISYRNGYLTTFRYIQVYPIYL
jgi:hypothetical protein